LLIFYTWQGATPLLAAEIPLVGPLIDGLRSQDASDIAETVFGGEYIAGSRTVSQFGRQFDWVASYYRYLVAPIGLSTLAIVWALARQVGRWLPNGRSRAEAAAKPDNQVPASLGDRIVLFLGIWWLLDVMFVWISPRSYVEYFLPLTASAAMLAAYAVYQCRRRTSGWIWLLALWLLVDLVLVWVIPVEAFPYVGLRSSEAVVDFWGQFLLRILPLAAAVAVVWLMRRQRSRWPQAVVPSLICAGMFFWWNTDTLDSFMVRSDQLRQIRRQKLAYPWEEVSRFVRQNSSPQDGLFVWGWYPGIYVQAQRFCPSTLAAYSDMHTDRPEDVKRQISKLVDELRADPPKFIVDSQKVHYPFGDHPVYDLWPQWKDKEIGKLNFRYSVAELLKHDGLLTLQEMEEAGNSIYLQVEEYSYALLTNEGRKGGPMEPARARRLARLERQRHEAIAPLREFVMKNYQPVPLRTEMHLYQRADHE
jgi:hypothetical protein